MNSVRPSFRSTARSSSTRRSLGCASSRAHPPTLGPRFRPTIPNPSTSATSRCTPSNSPTAQRTPEEPANSRLRGQLWRRPQRATSPRPAVQGCIRTHGPNQLRFRRHRIGHKAPLRQGIKARLEVGIFPFFEFPSGNADKGLGIGKTWYRMPLWLQKSWGPDDRQWTSYGGGGDMPSSPRKPWLVNYPFRLAAPAPTLEES